MNKFGVEKGEGGERAYVSDTPNSADVGITKVEVNGRRRGSREILRAGNLRFS